MAKNNNELIKSFDEFDFMCKYMGIVLQSNSHDKLEVDIESYEHKLNNSHQYKCVLTFKPTEPNSSLIIDLVNNAVNVESDPAKPNEKKIYKITITSDVGKEPFPEHESYEVIGIKQNPTFDNCFDIYLKRRQDGKERHTRFCVISNLISMVSW